MLFTTHVQLDPRTAYPLLLVQGLFVVSLNPMYPLANMYY